MENKGIVHKGNLHLFNSKIDLEKANNELPELKYYIDKLKQNGKLKGLSTKGG